MSEQIYDEQIAPKLMELGKLCQDNGMSLVAMVEYAPDQTGRTACLAKGSCFAIRLVDAAVQAHGNVDSLYIALARHAEEVGHSSMVLNMLGVKDRHDAAESDEGQK